MQRVGEVFGEDVAAALLTHFGSDQAVSSALHARVSEHLAEAGIIWAPEEAGRLLSGSFGASAFSQILADVFGEQEAEALMSRAHRRGEVAADSRRHEPL